MTVRTNKKVWSKFTDSQMVRYQDDVFNYYRKHGFLYYPTSHPWRFREFMKMKNYKLNSLIDENGHIKQTMHGLSLAWSYMPHSFHVQCGNTITPQQAFESDDLLRLAIRKRIKHGDNMSDSGMRKTIRMLSGVQGVSNFRPTAAAALYNEYASGGSVWDMSCGYGGRLLGFQISKACVYHGCEPATETYNALLDLSDDFITKENHIHKVGAEDMVLPENSIDFAFTSPPYFNWEKYSDEETQSYLKFPTIDDWVNNFLGKVLENSYKFLKVGGHCAINIANTKSAPNLESQCVQLANKLGFILVKTMGLKLSAMKKGYKIEPVFIFKK